MNEIKIFEKEEFGEVRVTEINGEPMFCLADVCRVLDIKNVSDCKSRLRTKGVATADTLTKGGVQQMTFIDESNLYKVIFQSRKTEAEAFQDWVCEEVLPSIRKTGAYSLPKDYLSALKALVVAEEEKQRLALENKIMQPKAEYFDKLVDRQLLTNFRDTAKELGIKQNDFINSLLKKGYIYRDTKGNIKPYAQHTPDLFEIKDYKSIDGKHVGSQTLITPKGKVTFSMLIKPETSPF